MAAGRIKAAKDKYSRVVLPTFGKYSLRKQYRFDRMKTELSGWLTKEALRIPEEEFFPMAVFGMESIN